MKFEPDPDVAQWLSIVDFSSDRFQWDKGNLNKNAKHKVTQIEVEEIFLSPFVLGGKIIEPHHIENRWILFGKTLANRHLSLIFTIRDNYVRPISCRTMRKEEKKVYEETIKR